ncbi:DNRLRE domain-containing protein [Streptomyces sp. WM6386]|uniref:DNRLRE domain-containing protein n=1 Tax=Streptomyces sp. WM6386 TaxID=1415558 RepID=UPI000698370F|nr:DNRLRE domain-containing protein [Streptomyces sp. WM6386]
MHHSASSAPAPGRRRPRRKQRASAAALLAALICAPLPLLNEPAFAEDAAPAADAPAVRQAAGARTEIVSKRTDSTTTWANADGTTTVEAYTGPIRVKQPDGSWRPVDTTLVAENGVVRPKSTAADITFSGGGSGEPLAEVSRDGRTLGLDWPSKLPAPRLDGPTAVYPDAVEGGDLVVTALKEGFSHSVVLHQRPDAPVSYRLPVSAEGLTLHETADDRLRWSDSGGHTVATAPLPVMWGSGEKRASGEPEDLTAIDVTIERDADTGDQVLVLKPDADFLADPALEYPVTIDPTDSLLGPVTDTWVQYDDYLTSQRGSTELKAGTYNGAEKARSYLKFDVAKYAGKHILDTDLRLYSYYSSTCSTANSGNQVRRITSAWDPSAITWSEQPTTTTTGAVTSTAAKGYNSSCAAGHVSWDVDGIVQAWADGQPNHGVRIAAVDETDPLTWRRYHSANQTDGSHNAAYEPSLTVTYNSKPGTATAVSPLSGTYTSDTTPTLSAKSVDADGQQLTLGFEVWAADGTAALKSGTSAAVASGAVATHTVAVLAPGNYKWRARASDGTDTGAWSAWQTFTVDTTVPSTPTITSTSHPSASAWYDATAFAGTLAATDASGVTGYAVKLDQSPTTAAGTAVTQTGTAVSWSGRADGTWWVHAAARDKAGLWSPTRHFGFNVDTTAPGAPGGLVSATHPMTTSAYANRTASFSWSAPADLSGAAGYTVAVDRTADTLPATTGTVQTSTNLSTTVDADGTWYLHVRAKDKAGNWSSTAAHLPFRVDMTLPPSPVISSSTHPDQTDAYKSGDFSATWTAPSGASAGYSIVVDGTADTVPDSTAEATVTSYATTRTEGTWYLHVRGIDAGGTGGATSHYRFTVDTTAPGTPAVTSAAYPSDAWAGGAQVTGKFTLTPDGTDTRSLTYRVDGAAAQTVTTTGGPVELPITPATEGSHQLVVTATDRAGNVSAETKYAFHAGQAAVTAPANGEVLVGSVDLAVDAPPSLAEVTFLQRVSATDPWQVIAASQVTRADGAAVTWPVPLTGGSAPKLLWDTSSLSGSGGRQIGARFGGAYAPPAAEPVSVIVDRVEVIDGGLGDGLQESEPAQAYALEQATARAAEDPDAFAPPYIDPATGELVAPVVESALADEASAPIQVTQAPADEGSGLPAEDTEEGTKPDVTSTEAETPAPPADGSVETTGEESFEMAEDTTETTPAPDGPTVTEQVAPRAEVVEHSVTALESVRDEVLQLSEAELPGVSGLHIAFVDPAENRVVVETETATPALVTALGERYGTDTVAVSLTPGADMVETQANRQNDTSPYYGGSRILSYVTTSSAKWCTAGFAWRYDGKWYMVTAGHCTSGNGAIMSPNESDYIGPVVRDNWRNGYGSVKLSGQSYYSGDLSLYRVNSDSAATPRIYKGGKTSSSSRLVHGYWKRWAQSGDKVCTGGMMTGELCGWKVTATQATIHYSGGTTAKNMVVAKKTSGSCTINGDSGGPVYTVDGSGQAIAKGILSGGGGGGGDNSGGFFDPCWLYFTDIGLANSAFPGKVAWY